jgi:hypothetical protein
MRRHANAQNDHRCIVELAPHVGVPGRPPPERWRKLVHEKVTQIDRLIADARTVNRLLLDTLDQKCPKLVERERALRDGRSGS